MCPTHTDTERETETQRHRDTERQRDTETHNDRHTDRQTDIDTHRDTVRETQTVPAEWLGYSCFNISTCVSQRLCVSDSVLSHTEVCLTDVRHTSRCETVEIASLVSLS